MRAFFMATSNTCVRLSIIASPRSFDPDGADNVPNPVIVPPALAIYVRYALDDEPLGNVTPSVCNRVLAPGGAAPLSQWA